MVVSCLLVWVRVIMLARQHLFVVPLPFSCLIRLCSSFVLVVTMLEPYSETWCAGVLVLPRLMTWLRSLFPMISWLQWLGLVVLNFSIMMLVGRVVNVVSALVVTKGALLQRMTICLLNLLSSGSVRVIVRLAFSRLGRRMICVLGLSCVMVPAMVRVLRFVMMTIRVGLSACFVVSVRLISGMLFSWRSIPGRLDRTWSFRLVVSMTNVIEDLATFVFLRRPPTAWGASLMWGLM